MNHTGHLFLAKAKPTLKQLPDGRWQLLVLAVDRIGTHQAEPWRICWTGGDDVRHWHTQALPWLTPGQALFVVLHSARCHHLGGAYAEIHAQATTMQLAMRPTTPTTTAQESTPDHAH